MQSPIDRNLKMGYTVLFLVTVVAAVPVVWCQTTTNSPCQSFLSSCVPDAVSSYTASMNNFNFTETCSSMTTVVNCYNQAALRPNCSQFADYINKMNSTASTSLSSYCPNGAPHPCLTGLRNCYIIYSNTNTTSALQLCSATNTAQSCIQALRCPPLLNSLVKAWEQDIWHNITMSYCAKIDPAVGACERDASACLDPIEKQIQADEQRMDFDHLCSVWPNATSCFDNLLADRNCTSEEHSMHAKITSFTTRYHQFCDVNDRPLSCLQALQNCTTEFQQISALPQYTTDPLVMCQGTRRLMTCLGRVDANLTSCKGISSVQGIASFQQKQAEVQQACSSILTKCTLEASDCVVTQDVKIAAAAAQGQAGLLCTLTGEFSKCLDPYLSDPDCSNNTLLLSEKTYVSELSAVCQSNSFTVTRMVGNHTTFPVTGNKISSLSSGGTSTTSMTGSKMTSPATRNKTASPTEGGDTGYAASLSVSMILLVVTTLWHFV